MLGKRVRIESSVGSAVECLVVAERLDGYIQAAQSLLVANTFSAVAIAQTRSAYRPCLCGLVFHESGVRRWAELDWFSGNCGPRIFEWTTGLPFVTVCLELQTVLCICGVCDFQSNLPWLSPARVQLAARRRYSLTGTHMYKQTHIVRLKVRNLAEGRS